MEDGFIRWLTVNVGFLRDYFHYIRSIEWNGKREERLRIDKYTCQLCCDSGEEVHHKHYNTLGHEDVMKDLISLCRACHKAVTSELRRR